MKRGRLGLSAMVSALSVLALHGTAVADIEAPPGGPAPFDILRTTVATEGEHLVFRMRVAGGAGTQKPAAVGQMAGADVYAYVWPTTLDSAMVGFEAGQGILALAVTFHPDFDDAAGGGRNRDVWHSHWVVLVKDDACGPAALKVRDIPAGTTPRLPATWPGVPILIDSPDYPPQIGADTVEVRIPRAAVGAPAEMNYDGVTAGLRVNGDMHSPLLCIVDVFDVASGNLSLPGVLR